MSEANPRRTVGDGQALNFAVLIASLLRKPRVFVFIACFFGAGRWFFFWSEIGVQR
jgi:hypothetical protein